MAKINEEEKQEVRTRMLADLELLIKGDKEEVSRVGHNWRTQPGPQMRSTFLVCLGAALETATMEQATALKAAFPDEWEQWDLKVEKDEDRKALRRTILDQHWVHRPGKVNPVRYKSNTGNHVCTEIHFGQQVTLLPDLLREVVSHVEGWQHIAHRGMVDVLGRMGIEIHPKDD